MNDQEILNELRRGRHRGFALWSKDDEGRFIGEDGNEIVTVYYAAAVKAALAIRRNREALSLDAVMPLLEAIVGDNEPDSWIAGVRLGDGTLVDLGVSTTFGDVRAVVAAWKARRQPC